MKTLKTTTLLLLCLPLFMRCVPQKQSAFTERKQIVNTLQYDSLLRKQREVIQSLSEKIIEQQKQINQRINESVNITETYYDSIGRIMRTINQNGTKNSHTETNETQKEQTSDNITKTAVDSILSVKLERLKAEIEKKEKTIIVKGLKWWQKTLIYLGILLIIIVFIKIMGFVFKVYYKRN